MLRELRNFVKERKQVSLKEMAIHFQIDESAVEGMAEQLIQRGDIRKVDKFFKCKGCIEGSCCDNTLYIWGRSESVNEFPDSCFC